MKTESARILIVDDEKGMRDLLSFMLRTEGYRVFEAGNGQMATEHLAIQDVDVVITDLMMPNVNGLELLRHIRERDADVVIIIMTAYASLQTAIESMKFGAYDYLIKPFEDVEKVMNTIARAVEHRKLVRRNARLLEDLQQANHRLEDMVEESQERTAELAEAYSELQELDQLKSRFLSNISHELRHPLALVKGYTRLMSDQFLGNLTEEQAWALRVVNERTDNLIQMVDDLLFMRDIETGSAYLCLEEIALPKLVHQVCQRMQGRARRKSMTLQVVAPDREAEAIPPIQGDPWRLEQALSHLLDSAIRFAEPGSTVSIEVKAGQEQLSLSLHSQGGELPSEALAHAGESLYQRQFGGNDQQPFSDMGLSLSLVRTIAEMHGGDLVVANEPGQGATITLTLPLEDKGRLLNLSMALDGDLADRFRTSLGVFPEPQPAWHVAAPTRSLMKES